jgi:hypothetical protein
MGRVQLRWARASPPNQPQTIHYSRVRQPSMMLPVAPFDTILPLWWFSRGIRDSGSTLPFPQHSESLECHFDWIAVMCISDVLEPFETPQILLIERSLVKQLTFHHFAASVPFLGGCLWIESSTNQSLARKSVAGYSSNIYLIPG